MTKKYKFLAYEGSSTINPPDPNVPINFNLNVKIDDEELVFRSNHKFNVNIIELLTPSKNPRIVKKRTGKHTKPPNSFIIYMRDNYNLPEFDKMEAKHRLPKIRDRWKREPKEKKELYEACARIAKNWYDKGAVNYEENGSSSPNSPITSTPPPSNSLDISSTSPSNSPVTSMPFLSNETSSPFPSNSPAMPSPSLSYSLNASSPFPSNSSPVTSMLSLSTETSSPFPSNSPAISSPSLSYFLNTPSPFPSNSPAISSPSSLITPTTSSSFLESQELFSCNAGFDDNNIQSGLTEFSSTNYSSISTNFPTPSAYDYDQINNVNCNMDQINNAQQYNYLNTSDHNFLNTNEVSNMADYEPLQDSDYEYVLLAIPRNQGLAYRPKLNESNNNLYLFTETYQKHTESNNFYTVVEEGCGYAPQGTCASLPLPYGTNIPG
ncbi:hypothetical protein RhiirA5_415864 [Rhizophagus irregularis]|uniref:MATA-HMG n=1 Tax=Rhizophagus irregularis TaxID=588596 RepID=A0A1B1EUU7_9GLOM|nr:MATA-HMG [Rhizophagus irregularis]ANQ32588.1 MATA-HMG [Rhizophagus irregularis]PKC09278.1 hypothetical protein RhiirA5_415864 [Rhizophagus irregularis]PKY18455.1 hypothetical protein RhiirB3_431273 [Rhizophagus irregularis]CAB5216690.1 unnamed protein product [Rhizophagus irregularis]